MQNIVLIFRENQEKVTHVSVFLCNRVQEAALFCGFVKNLALEGGEKINAKHILAGKEYALEKGVPFDFENIVEIDDRMIQKMMRELSADQLARALQGASQAVQEKIFRNMSRRAALMLKEDMEYMGPLDEGEVQYARQSVIDAYTAANALECDARIEAIYADNLKSRIGAEDAEKDGSPDWAGFRDYDEEKTHAALVFRGRDDLAEKVSVLLFDSEKSAAQFCLTLNRLPAAKGAFIYARRAEQMVEYETEPPPVRSFDRIFDCGDDILGRSLARAGYKTVINAVKGLDKRSREKIFSALPEYMEQKVLEETENIRENSKTMKISFSGMMAVQFARERIVETINAVVRAREKKTGGEFSGRFEVMKD
jgi:hypothetical protein